MSINRVTISGNLTRDPELRRTQSGMTIMGFGVAVNDRRKNTQTGQWEDYANFIDCTMFGERADKLAPYLAKGAKVAIEGKLRWSQWERDGQKRSKVEVIIDDIEFMSSRQQGQQGGYAPPSQQQGGSNYAPQPQSAPQQAPQAQQPQYQQQPPQQYAPAQQAPVQQAPPMSGVYDEDIPF